jgi:hypothetical protein
MLQYVKLDNLVNSPENVDPNVLPQNVKWPITLQNKD